MTDQKPAVHEALAVYAPEMDETERVPPGYKRTELGVIPEDWEVCELQNLGQWRGGATPAMKNPAYWLNGSIPWASSGDIKVVLLEKTHSSITELAVKQTSTSLLPKDCIIVVTRSGILRKYLPVAKNVVPLAINQDLKALLPNDDVEADFVLHQLIANGPEILATCQKAGTTVESIEYAWLKSFSIPLPHNLEEQRAIAAALSDVDDLISALDRLIAKKRAVKTAAMQQLLTGKQRLPGFSGEWSRVELGELGHFAKGKGIRRNELVSDGLPCVRYGEIYTLHHDYIRTFHSFIPKSVAQMSQRIRRGDLLFTGSGETVEEIGKCVAYLGDQEAYAGGDIVILSPESGNSMFLGYLMNHSSVVTQKSSLGQGDAVVHISARNLASLEFDLPPIEEQTAIAAVLSDMDAEIEALEGRREKTRRIKQGMMQELLTGRTRLCQTESLA